MKLTEILAFLEAAPCLARCISLISGNHKHCDCGRLAAFAEADLVQTVVEHI